jgi:hypothetical protein
MAHDTRKVTNKIYDAVDQGILTWEQVSQGALSYMNEDDVAAMAHNEEFFLYEDEDEDELTLDELTEQARCSVEELIDEIRSTDPDDLGAAIWQVAYDAVIGNGGEDSQASIIAGYMRTQF